MNISHERFPVTPPGSPGQPAFASAAGRIREMLFCMKKPPVGREVPKRVMLFPACRERARAVNIWDG